jgi:hypothetical protein
MSIVVAIAPPLAAAGVAAALTSPPAVALGAGAVVAGVAALAAAVGPRAVADDVAQALRGALAAMTVRLIGGGALVIGAAALLPTQAALVAGITGIGLAGATLLPAWLASRRREVTGA